MGYCIYMSGDMEFDEKYTEEVRKIFEATFDKDDLESLFNIHPGLVEISGNSDYRWDDVIRVMDAAKLLKKIDPHARINIEGSGETSDDFWKIESVEGKVYFLEGMQEYKEPCSENELTEEYIREREE